MPVGRRMSDATWMQDRVKEFHLATNSPAPESIDLGSVRIELRAKLIIEEAIETVEAMGYRVSVRPVRTTRGVATEASLIRVRMVGGGYKKPNWPEVIDGLCDLVYVTLGTAVEAGINLNPFFREVHRSNMLKIGGPVRADGKALKPEGWEPPRIDLILDRLLSLSDKEA